MRHFSLTLLPTLEINMDFDKEIAQLREWFASPRFAGIRRVHTAREVAEQRGTIRTDYVVARAAAEAFYERLRELFARRSQVTTFGPYSPGQAVAMKRLGIEAISCSKEFIRNAFLFPRPHWRRSPGSP